jgi:hypothetical protein
MPSVLNHASEDNPSSSRPDCASGEPPLRDRCGDRCMSPQDRTGSPSSPPPVSPGVGGGDFEPKVPFVRHHAANLHELAAIMPASAAIMPGGCWCSAFEKWVFRRAWGLFGRSETIIGRPETMFCRLETIIGRQNIASGRANIVSHRQNIASHRP